MQTSFLVHSLCALAIAALLPVQAQITTNPPPVPDFLLQPPPSTLPASLGPAPTNAVMEPLPTLPAAQPEPAPKADAPKPKPAAPPAFQGKITELDKFAMTIKVASKKSTKTFKITSKTRFFKEGKPSTFSDLAEETAVAVTSKKAKGGGLEAVTVRVK